MLNLLANGTGLATGAIVAIVVVSIIVLLAVGVIVWYIKTHNAFIALGGQADEAFSTVDVYLKKRYDLIPNLVETVKGYAKHESETLQNVIQARTQASNAVTPEEKLEADKAVTQAIRNFNMVMENYPELKANVNFLDLQGQLKSIESELSQSRKYYNATVKVFNVKLGSFPSSIVGKRMKLPKRPFFEVSAPEERQNVKVQF